MEIARIIVGIVHIILSILIIVLILLQSGKQAGLSGAVAGAGESFFGKNKGKTLDAAFSRFTKICAIGFLCTSLFLAYSYAADTKKEAAPDVTEPIVTMAPIEGEAAEGEETVETPAAETPATPAETPAAAPTATPVVAE